MRVSGDEGKRFKNYVKNCDRPRELLELGMTRNKELETQEACQ